MAGKRKQHYSGIGGQALLEGVMMRNHDMVACAVRKPTGEIEVEVDEHHPIGEGTIWTKIPLIRGVLAFIDSMIVGFRSINYSSEIYMEDEESKKDPEAEKKENSAVMGISMVIGVVLGLLLFVYLPLLFTDLLSRSIRSQAFLSLIEGLIRIGIFIAYMAVISAMKDMHRMYQYHGAEHKCINCIERGKPLTVQYVAQSTRFHKRCGTSYLFLIMLVSVVLFFFIRVDNRLLRFGLRLLLIPVVAGIAYEILRAAGRSDNLFIRIVSAPGIWLQHLTTKEPDTEMIEAGIRSVEAVFDWKAYLVKEFHYDPAELSHYEKGGFVENDEVSG
jgi:uncharacterized protein YqhQ